MAFVRGPAMRSVAIGLLALSLAACGTFGRDEPQVETDADRGLFGLGIFSGGDDAEQSGPAQIGVNGYLWRASLDTLAFMPLASADAYGGLINTEWYVNPEKTDERFKATVYILDTRLRADGVNVALHRQTRGANGEWVDAPASADAEEAIENAILTRARQLRVGGR